MLVRLLLVSIWVGLLLFIMMCLMNLMLLRLNMEDFVVME